MKTFLISYTAEGGKINRIQWGKYEYEAESAADALGYFWNNLDVAGLNFAGVVSVKVGTREIHKGDFA